MSSTIIFNTILNFLNETPVEYITAATVIFKALEIDSTISKENLLELSINAINKSIKIDKNSKRLKKFYEIPKQVNFKYLKNFFFILNDDDADIFDKSI